MTHDNTILTKWGRITSHEWLRRKQNEQLDRCMGPEQMHYVLTHTPFHDANGNEIIDYAFRHLLDTDYDAAIKQLDQEFIADRHWVALRQRRLAEQRAIQQQAQAEAAKTRPRKPRTRHTHNHTQPSLI